MSQPSKTVAILGGGPAGMSAALWLKNFGLNPILFEQKDHLGGMQSLNTLENPWVLGSQNANGPEIATSQIKHLQAQAIRTRLGCCVTNIEGSFQTGFTLTTQHDQQGKDILAAKAVIIATGTSPNIPEQISNFPEYQQLRNRGILSQCHECFVESRSYNGRKVLIIGGGDNAFENAAMIADRGGYVHLLIRRTARAQSRFLKQIAVFQQRGLVQLHEKTELSSIESESTGFCAQVVTASTRHRIGPYDYLHVLTGYKPNTHFLESVFSAKNLALFDLSDQHYLLTDSLGRTPYPGIYAAGDVANPQHPCVVSAISSGAACARAIEYDLRKTL